MGDPTAHVDQVAAVRALRGRLDHPVIDGDGHFVENFPVLAGTVDELYGLEAVDTLVSVLRADPITTSGSVSKHEPRGPWWGISNDADDVATAAIPGLLAARMGELGFDFSVLYPTLGLGFPTIRDDEVRRMACRALNVMNARLTAAHADRMTAVAVIPMHTPAEALDELRHATTELGSKVVMIAPGVARPVAACPEAFPVAHRVDRYGLDSDHDYDPVWAFAQENGLAVSVHGGVGYRYLPPAQGSATNYVANHVLGHASLLIETAKAFVLGGVYHRFPDLHVAYLEGGAGWAVHLMHSLVEHFEKRGPEGLELIDPSQLDSDRLNEHFVAAGMPKANPSRALLSRDEAAEPGANEFAQSGLRCEEDIVSLFSHRFFLGCEGDDRSVRQAFDTVGNVGGVRLAAFFSSDIGHWDVPRLAPVLLHSRGLVEAGAITDDDYRDFAFANAVRFHAGANPAFFEGTAISTDVADELASGRSC